MRESVLQLPQTAEYAVRAVVHIAGFAHSRHARVREVASGTAIPRNYLSKMLHQLARAGVLESARGPTGGFRLAQAPDKISLGRIVGVFGSEEQRRCFMGGGKCGEKPECVLHTRWEPVALQLRDFLNHTTVADLIIDSTSRPEVTPL